MKVVQLLPTLAFGDAIGNDTLAIKELLVDIGYQTKIYAENIDSRLPNGTAYSLDKFPTLSCDDVILYHGSTGTALNYKLPELGGKAVMIYHNITPPEFFAPYSTLAMMSTEGGLAGMRNLSDKVSYCIADSQFNKNCLREMGYTCPIDVCPILIPFEDYEKEPDSAVMKRYQNDGYTNLLFVGRIAPNKKQEDVIAAFYCYHKYYNNKSRLFLVGNWSGMENYYERLCNYVESLGIADSVVFPGHIRFREILAYYRLADGFICMSEHEGFCVPLVEAMYFKVPIIAYAATAIPETLGDAGILLNNKKPALVASAIDRVIRDGELRKYLRRKEEQRLAAFSQETVKNQLSKCIERAVKAV